jgi:hypothetical protein
MISFSLHHTVHSHIFGRVDQFTTMYLVIIWACDLVQFVILPVPRPSPVQGARGLAGSENDQLLAAKTAGLSHFGRLFDPT